MADASSEFNKMSLQFERTTARLDELQTSAVQLGTALAGLNVSVAAQSGGSDKSEPAGGADGGSEGGEQELSSGLGALTEQLDTLIQLTQKGADFEAKIALLGKSIPNFSEDMRQNLAAMNRGLTSDKNILASGGDRDAIFEAQQEAMQSHGIDDADAAKLGEYTRNIGLYAASAGISFKDASADVLGMHDKLKFSSEKDFTQFGDAVTALGSTLEVQVSDIGKVLATSGDWAAKASVSREDGAALVTTLLKSGMGQQDAGSSFASMMKSISNADSLSVGNAQQLGFGSGGELKAAMQHDMMGTLTALLDKLAGLDPDSQVKLATQLFGTDGQKIVGALKDDKDKTLGSLLQDARFEVGSVKGQDGKFKEQTGSAPSMASQAAEASDTAKMHFAQMYSQFEHLSLIMSESLLPVTVAVADDVAWVVGGLNNFLEACPGLTKGIGGVVAAFIAGKAAAAGLNSAFSGVKFLVTNAKKLLGKGGEHSDGDSGHDALASSANKAADAIHRLTGRIAELGSAASSSNGGAGDDDDDDVEPSSQSDRDRHKRAHKGNRFLRRWRVFARRLRRSGVGRLVGKLGGTRLGKMALAGLGGLGSSLLGGEGVIHGMLSSGMSLFSGEGLMSKAAGLFSGEGSIVSKVMGSGVLKGAGKLAGKLFKPLGFLQDGWNLAEGLANGDSHQVGKSAGSAVGGWGGGLAGAAAGAAIGSVVPIVGTAIGGVVGGVLGSLGGSSVGEWLGDKAANVYDWFAGGSKDNKDGEQSSGWMSKMASVAAKGVFPLTALMPSIDTIKSMGSKLADMGSSAWQTLRDKGGSMLSSVAGAAKSVMSVMPSNVIGQKLVDIGASAWQVIRDQGSSLFDTAKNLVQNVSFESIGHTLADVGRNVWQSVRNKSSNLLSSLKGSASELLSMEPLKALAGSLAEQARTIWANIREQGGQILASLKESAMAMLPDGDSPRHWLDYLFGGDETPVKTMTASKAVPPSRLHDPKSSADAVINSTGTTQSNVTQNINVTLHASSDPAQNQQLINQLIQRLRDELAGGQPGANNPLNRRINAGLTDAATA